MPFVHNTRTLDFASADVKIRYVKNGVVTTHSVAELNADTDLRAEILTASGVGAGTVEARKTGYVKDGSQNVLDTDGNILANTYLTGKQPDYTTENFNTVALRDTTA